MYRADPVLIVFGGVSDTHITKEKPEQVPESTYQFSTLLQG
jgi:hypothetical protein